MPKPLVAGNWKMNGTKSSVAEFKAIELGVEPSLLEKVDIMICPPATLLSNMNEHAEYIQLGAQDCHHNESGAHTGDLSAAMLVDGGAGAIIVGHSERRADHNENNDLIMAKADASHNVGAIAIICVGETRNERDSGKAIDIVLSQVKNSTPDNANGKNTILAYEPVWAIGTGLVPTIEDVQAMHFAIRKYLVNRFGDEGINIRILYGGSVKPSNAKELMAIENVNGALVGGASLKADDFLAIAKTYI